jgi:hypothetical protein
MAQDDLSDLGGKPVGDDLSDLGGTPVGAAGAGQNGFNAAVTAGDSARAKLVAKVGFKSSPADATRRSLEVARPDYAGMGINLARPAGALGGAEFGATMGAPLGPLGMAGGGILGAGLGFATGGAAADAMNRLRMALMGANPPRPTAGQTMGTMGKDFAMGAGGEIVNRGTQAILSPVLAALARTNMRGALGVSSGLKNEFPTVDIPYNALKEAQPIQPLKQVSESEIVAPSSESFRPKIEQSSSDLDNLIQQAAAAGHKIDFTKVPQSAIDFYAKNSQRVLGKTMTAADKAAVVEQARQRVEQAVHDLTNQPGQVQTTLPNPLPPSVTRFQGVNQPSPYQPTVPGPMQSQVPNELSPLAAKPLKQYFQNLKQVQASFKANGQGQYNPAEELMSESIAKGLQDQLEGIPKYGVQIGKQEMNTQRLIALERAYIDAERGAAADRPPLTISMKDRFLPKPQLNPQVQSRLALWLAAQHPQIGAGLRSIPMLGASGPSMMGQRLPMPFGPPAPDSTQTP